MIYYNTLKYTVTYLFRVLVFYDDGFAQYTTLDKLHLVCESGICDKITCFYLFQSVGCCFQGAIFGRRWQDTPGSSYSNIWIVTQL